MTRPIAWALGLSVLVLAPVGSRRGRLDAVTASASSAWPTTPWTWHIAEVFKVGKGLLHEIEAVLERAPYGMTSGRSSWDDA